MNERMITHRKYLGIVMLMLVLLFMFMFTAVARESISEYDVNEYAIRQAASGESRWLPYAARDGIRKARAGKTEAGRAILLFGSLDNALGDIVSQWCLYTKRELVVESSAGSYVLDSESRPEMVLVDAGEIDCGQEAQALIHLADRGVDLVFCSLPDPSLIRRRADLRELLGIQRVEADEVEAEGIWLFDGFLLGGEAVYAAGQEKEEQWQDGELKESERQDLELTMPWYVTLSGTRTYAMALLDEEIMEDQEDRNENLPAVIWRNSYGNARVFAVNGNYMSGLTGLGLLSAISYEAKDYELYPVINAQNVVLKDFPSFAGENAGIMQEVYSRSPRAVQRDVVWPSMLSIISRAEWKLTSLLSPQYDYQDGIEPDTTDLNFYLQQFKEAGAEVGVSFYHGEDISLEEKIRRDEDFFRSTETGYVYSAAYAGGTEFQAVAELEEVTEKLRTVAFEYQPDVPLVSYLSDRVTGQSITGDAKRHTYSENLQLRSLETALGYSNVQLDLHEVLWPENEKSHWEKLSKELSGNLSTWWKPFQAFERTTLTESDSRLRRFLNLDFSSRRTGDRLVLDVEGMEGRCWFLLRTHGEGIAKISGGDYQAVEKDAYLVCARESQVEILLEKTRGTLKYEMPVE